MEIAIFAAYYNIVANAENLEDKDYSNEVLKEAEKLIKNATANKQKILDILDKR